MKSISSNVLIEVLHKTPVQMFEIFWRITSGGDALAKTPSDNRTMIIYHWDSEIHYTITVSVKITGVDRKCNCGHEIFVGEIEVFVDGNNKPYTVDIWMEPLSSTTRSGKGFVSARDLIPEISPKTAADKKTLVTTS